jgi:hypothetical protein
VQNAAVEAAGPRTETFLVPMGRYFGYVVVGAGVLLAVLGIVGQGTDAFGLIGFCVAFSLLAWVVLIRPQVTAHRNGLLLRNMLRDTFLPYSCIKSCRIAQTLQIGTRDKVYHGLGVSKSARQAARERRQIRRQEPIGPNTGAGRLEFPPKSDLDSNRTDVNVVMQEHVVKNNFTHTEERIEALVKRGAASTAGQSPKVVWDVVPLVALVAAAGCAVLGLFV